MGLDATTIGSSSIQRTIRLRMKATGVDSLDDYVQLISNSAAEWNQLVEAVVVTETWFFRDRQAFNVLVSDIAKEWLPANATGRLRILSLPCSSGEEPYSIAMSLLDAGVPAARFAIDAVDLSERALEKALAGVYGKNSFRGDDLSFRDRYFSTLGESFTVRQEVRDCVTFRQANMLGDDFPLARASYDFIFCRNLLIYFDRATQDQAFKRLESLLLPKGILFVGPAEIPLAMENGFASLNLAMAFACRRIAEHQAPAKLNRVAQSPPKVPIKISSQPALPKPAKLSRPKSTQNKTAQIHSLQTARQLADDGKLDEAVRICHAHLDHQGASVDAYYLLGVIHDAQGNGQAREFYRKALYLDPNHYESLLQMAFLAEREGDSTTARNLRRRAQRQEIKKDEAA